MTIREEVIGDCRLILGDCREILPRLDRPSAIASDPPYGQKLNTNVTGRSVSGRKPGAGREYRVPAKGSLRSPPKTAVVWPTGILGDDRPFDPEHLLQASDRVLLWGAHKFGHKLPRGRWLAWDKVPTGKIRDQGDGELAWTNVEPDAALRIYRLLWDGVCVGPAARHEVTAGTQRAHPTQKPEALMSWCLGFLNLTAGAVICDPYMGAGSPGVAAVRAGYGFVGIELEQIYFDTACRRVEEAYRQPRLFADAPVVSQTVQHEIDLRAALAPQPTSGGAR